MAQKFKIYQGTSLDYYFYLAATNTEGVETRINLTGCSIRCQIRKKQADYETFVHADLSTANGKIVIEDALNGLCKFNVSYLETADWKFDEAILEFEITYANNVRHKLPIACQLIREYVR